MDLSPPPPLRTIYGMVWHICVCVCTPISSLARSSERCLYVQFTAYLLPVLQCIRYKTLCEHKTRRVWKGLKKLHLWDTETLIVLHIRSRTLDGCSHVGSAYSTLHGQLSTEVTGSFAHFWLCSKLPTALSTPVYSVNFSDQKCVLYTLRRRRKQVYIQLKSASAQRVALTLVQQIYYTLIQRLPHSLV